jgi:hypothetical protein
MTSSQQDAAIFTAIDVAAKDNRVAVDITQRNAELQITVSKIDPLRKAIDAIVAHIEAGKREDEELEV